jgi:hypothetical protein
MASEFSPTDVAARLRGILAGLDRGMIEATARRLGVSEVALRMSVDELEPHPAMEVLIAVVRHHGVDPTWLLTGEYDAATHRAAINDEATRSKDLVAIIAKHMTPPVGTDNVNRANLKLEA